ncbi:cache domain-containing protein [Glaciecola sp. 2405UD65-10]|uniref:cache domain-containing protein n=1 Tax=Glaciecola sp. 2405UD65-10 TaxID=3397244 RepID=UPI003B591A53
MSFSLRMQFFAVAQVILTALLTYFLVTHEYRNLSAENVSTLEIFLIAQKQQELKNYTAIAKASIQHIYDMAGANDEQAKAQVAAIISSLLYNTSDGYFFVYDDKGTNIVLPTEPERNGNNYWELLNNKGEPTIQILIENAKNGGDFYRYDWNQPSTENITEKMSYSDFLPKWGWMLGTGVYLDNVKQQMHSVHVAIDQQIANTRFIILVVAITSIFFIFIVGTWLNLSQKKASDTKINELGQKIVTLQEEEQRHISRELHDGIVQVLVSIKYSLEATGKYLQKMAVEKPAPLEKAQDNLSNAIGEIRRISHHLHPRILDELGLSAAIEALGNEFSERTGVAISINKPALSKLLPDHINTTLYRVVQESLMNIERHANANTATINLTIKDNWLTLQIADDGVGMPENGTKCTTDVGIGTRNLAERVEYHSGTFCIESDNSGTTVIAKIPRSAFANYYTQTKEAAMHKENI